MNDAGTNDPIEAELHSLRPRDLPPDLVRRIETALESDRAAALRRRLWAGAAAVTGLAAAVALVVVLSRGGATHTAPPDGVIVRTNPVTQPGDHGQPRPRPMAATLGAYRSAYGSPEVLDSLLSRDAAAFGGRPLRAGALRDSDARPDDANDRDPLGPSD